MAALISEAWPWMRELGGGGGISHGLDCVFEEKLVHL